MGSKPDAPWDAGDEAELDELIGERHIEMTWRCSVCQTQNLGRFKSCQGCGKPKDATEEYEMPDDPASAASVTDAALLRMATAGPDWRCAYCNSDQRAIDGACGQCGASPSEPAAAQPVPLLARPARPWIRYAIGGAIAVAAVIALVIWNARRPHDYDGTVTAVAWEQVIDVEHYGKHEHQGFRDSIPSDATEITSVGQQVHHQEQVLDHMETEHYTEQVPDGFRTEHYTDHVSCGQDCRSTPKSCHEECTSKKNGFASCKQVCSGGGQSCTTRYCNEDRTRQIAQTRTESRTRQVPRYRSEPRYAEAFRYNAFDWTADRTVRADGTTATGVRWPDNGARTVGLLAGEQEREHRHASYTVTLRYHGDQTVKFAVATPEALARFGGGSTHAVRRVQDALFVDGAPIMPLASH